MKKISTSAIILIIAAIVLIVIGIFFLYKNQDKIQQPPAVNNHQQTTAPMPTPTPTPTPVASKSKPSSGAADWKIFKDKYGFQMQYPADKRVMNAPVSEVIACNNSCPAELKVNNIQSSYANQKINGVDYCIYSGSNSGTSRFYADFLFLTINNGACYGLDISYSNINCSSLKSDVAVKSCKTQENANQILISKALSSIEFTK